MGDGSSSGGSRWAGPTADVLSAALRAHYGIDPVSVETLGGGQDSKARTYRVETARHGSRYLVKARPSTSPRDVAAAVLSYLHQAGVPHVVAPIRSTANALAVADAGISLTVYPFLDGRTGVDAGLSGHHWRMLGVFARHLHASSPPPALAAMLARENYRPAEIDVVRHIDSTISNRRLSVAAAPELGSLWRRRRRDILDVVERTESLGERLQHRALPLVLCHADLHAWNVLVETEGELWVVDWDETILAPKERDLMFVVGGIGPGMVEPHQTAAFLDGYHDRSFDRLALAYYRCAWATQDIGGYAGRLLAPSPGEADRADELRIFRSLFEPGEILEIALTSAWET